MEGEVEVRSETDVQAEAQEVQKQPAQEPQTTGALEEKKGIFGGFAGVQKKKAGAFGGAAGQPKKGVLGSIKEALSKFISDSRRIFIISKKPTMEEYRRMAIIVALGIVLIGIIGFIIILFFSLAGIGF